MGSKGDISSAQSLERFLNRSVLFVQGIDPNVPKNEVVQVLSQVCKQPQQGRIDILISPEGKNRGTAFLNFHNRDDAKAALEKWRFGLELRGRQLRMQYSSDREYKDAIQGHLVSRFKILVRNIPEELGPEELFDKFSEYGEILQVHTARDHYGQYYAIIQYVEVASVRAAISRANRERVFNHVLLVESYKPNVPFQPMLRSASGNSAGPGAAAGTGTGAAGGRSVASSAQSQGLTLAALQLQEEQQQEAQGQDASHSYGGGGGAEEQTDASAAGTSGGDGGGGAAAAAGSSGGLFSFPPFFAAAAPSGAQAAVTTAGSLHSLLSTALHHVHMLDELLCCPITQEPLVDPVVAADGNTYERIAIQAWLDKHDTSPLTNQVLSSKALLPNNLVRKIMEELKGTGTAAADGDVASAAAGAIPELAAMNSQARAESAAAAVAAAEAEAEAAVPVPIPAVPATHLQPANVLYVVPSAVQLQKPELHQMPQGQQQYYQAQHPQHVVRQPLQMQAQHPQYPLVPQLPLQIQMQAQAQAQSAVHNPTPFNLHTPAFYTYRPMGL